MQVCDALKLLVLENGVVSMAPDDFLGAVVKATGWLPWRGTPDLIAVRVQVICGCVKPRPFRVVGYKRLSLGSQYISGLFQC